MRVAVVCAIEKEYEALRSRSDIKETMIISGKRFFRGILGGKEIICCISGMGKVNAAAVTEALILKFAPDVVINSGVCGGIDPEYRCGDVVIVSDCVQHDVDTTPLGDERAEITDIGVKYFPCDNKVVSDFAAAARGCLTDFSVRIGRIATGDQFISSDEKSKEIAELFDADCVDMETCSIAQVCYLNETPFCAVRAISDSGSDSAFESYEAFLDAVVGNSVKILESYSANLS